MRDQAYFTKWWRTRREKMVAVQAELFAPGDVCETFVGDDLKTLTFEVYDSEFRRLFELSVGYVIQSSRLDKENLARALTLETAGDSEEARRCRAAGPDMEAFERRFNDAIVPALVRAATTQAPVAAKEWGETKFPKFLVGLVFATADIRTGATEFDDALAEFLAASPPRREHLLRPDGGINPDTTVAGFIRPGEGHTRQDAMDVDSALQSLRHPETPGAKKGSTQAKKRDPDKFRREWQAVGRLWQKAKNPILIFSTVTGKPAKTEEQARKWVARRYCAWIKSEILNGESRTEPDADTIRILKIEPYIDKKSHVDGKPDLYFWKLTR